jgi:hypothetical protein
LGSAGEILPMKSIRAEVDLKSAFLARNDWKKKLI